MLPRVFLESVTARELTELCHFYAMRDQEADKAGEGKS